MSSKTKTTATKEEAKPALVPKLRFPEFRGAEAWNGIRLGDAADIKTGPFGSTLHQSDYVLKGTPIVTVEHLSEGGLVHQNLPMVSDEDKQRLKSYVLRPGDIVFSRVGSVDRNSLVRDEENGWLFSGRLLRIRTSSKLLTPSFLSFYFQLETTKHKLRSVAVGQTMASLNTEILSDFPVVTARLTEQQIIAECLSSVDELIAAQARKVDALKIHKKGLMQQLFPREGETQPRLRFPEFRKVGEWHQRPLGSLCRIRTGKKDANEGATDGIYPFFTCAEKHIYSHSYSFDAEAILIAGNANVGQTNYYTGKFEAYQRTYVLTDFNSISVPYLYSVLSANLRPDLLAQVQTSAMSYIRLPMLEEYQIHAPSAHAEQQRIASCLSSLDTLITAQAQKLDALKTHKKALMQGLFPSPEEVAG